MFRFSDFRLGGLREAQLAVARIYMDAGRTPEGIQAMEAFLTRFPESAMVTQVNAEIESARVAG